LCFAAKHTINSHFYWIMSVRLITGYLKPLEDTDYTTYTVVLYNVKLMATLSQITPSLIK